MKTQTLKSAIVAIVFSLFIISCNTNDDVVEIATQDIETSEIILNEDFEAAQNEVDSFTDDVIDNEDTYFGTNAPVVNTISYNLGETPSTDLKRPIRKRHIPDGATVTKVDDTENNTRTVTIDFGDGVTGKKGKVFKGKIILVYVRTDDSKTVTQTFENFFVDDKYITGTNVHIKVKSNENQNRQTTSTINTQITWTDGQQGTRTGTRVKELTEGAGDQDHSNNVYKITGSWNATYINGNTFNVEITEPLIRKMECKGQIVQGTKVVTKNGVSVTVDFGDGTCPEDGKREIEIRKGNGEKTPQKFKR